MKSNLKLFVNIETPHWDSKFIKQCRIKSIKRLYLTDCNRPTHLCSLDTSLWAIALYPVVEFNNELTMRQSTREKLSETFEQADYESGSAFELDKYFKVNEFLPTDLKHYNFSYKSEKNYSALLENVREYLCANHVY